MRQKLAGLAVFSLIVMMIVPVNADVDMATLNKETFSAGEKFTIEGTVSDANRVTLLAAMKGPGDEKLTRTAMSDFDGTFSFIPVNVDDLFKTKGIYEINVFTEFQKPENGTKIKVSYEKGKATLLPNFELILNEIGNKVGVETEELSFTASVTDSSIEDLEYSLEKHPSGATINKDTGKFSWTPDDTQVGGYIFDVVVKAGPLEDRETITVTISEKPETKEEIKDEPKTEPKVNEEPKVNLDDTNGFTDEHGIAPFVDETKDPQNYVDVALS